MIMPKKSCLNFLIPLFSLFIGSCDLFNASVQDDFLGKIDEEIAWANAARLDVRVQYNPLWGSSPQQGTLDRETHRQGYAFDVEFTPAMGYGLAGLFAFRTNGLDLANIDVSEALNGKGVEIVPVNTVGGTLSFKITINVTYPVTLVPLCSDRPRLSQRTSPPLFQTLMSFPYNQRIHIWFNMPVNRYDLIFGKEKITISGHYLIGNIGEPFQGRENGDIQEYFQLEFPPYSDSSSFINQVILLPREQGASALAYLNITVRVGPDIENEVGASMAQAESIVFMTDSSEAENVFLAYNIEAQAADEQWFGDNQLFNNQEIDRCYLPGETLSLRFDADFISQNIPLNAIRITEQMVCNLDGSPLIDDEPLLSQEYYNFTFEQNTYTLDYTIQTEKSGIIQLLVLPWNLPSVNPLKPADATLQGRYVTIVVDNEAPELDNPNVAISNYSRKDVLNHFIYGPLRAVEGVIVTIENLGDIRDNTHGGIPFDKAERYPWTESKELYWRVMIGNEGEDGTITSEWKDVFNGSGGLNNQWQSDSIIDLENEAGYPVFVKFKDRLDNETAEWIDTKHRVKYKGELIYPVTELSAEYNAAGNTIAVSWKNPSESSYYPEFRIEIQPYEAKNNGDTATDNKIEHHLDEGTINYTYTIESPRITTDSVWTGSAVSGVRGYEISVFTSQDIKTGPIWVYNIPGMSVTETNTVRITDANQLSTLTSNDLAKNIILTRDIAISNHTPISTFTGKFYGNGHTVTINGMNNSSANMGLFGIASNALIRDLTVVMNTNVTYSGTGEVYIGGITGQAQNNTMQILNCMARGTLDVTSGVKIHAGGITGSLYPAAKIENCYSNINLSATETSNGIICAGGITGQIWTHSPNLSTNTMINKVTAAGNVTATNNGATSTGSIYLGGIVGECRGLGLIKDATVSGTLTMTGKGTTTGFNYICGGIIGRMEEGNLENPVFKGTITIPDTHSTTRETLVGGIVGTAGNDRVSTAKNTAKLTVTNATAEGNITINSNASGTITAGGVCAASDGSSVPNAITFDNCEYKTGRISVGSTNSILGNIGGFVGEYKTYTTITNCKTTAAGININFAPGTGTKDVTLNAGGFAGKATGDGQVFNGLNSNSPVAVTIGAFRDADLRVGGFVGYHTTGRITNCFASGSVTVTSNHTNNAIGIQTGGFGGETNVPIDNSYALGNVTVNIGTSSKDVILRTGGFTGYHNTGSITKCFASGSVTVTSNHTNNATGINTGGFGGETNVPIDNSYATGNVSVTIGASQTAVLRTGGFTGYHTTVSINKCFARGSVTVNSSHTGQTYGIQTGGFAGELRNNVSIDNSYALGTVKVDKKIATNSTGTINTGGFVGIMVGGTIQHSFSAGREIISLYNGSGDRWCRSGGFAGELANMSAVAVALCEYVHAKGANNSAAGRAVAFYGNCGLGFRAYDGMRVNANMSYPNTDLGNTVNSSGGDTHGINTSADTLATASFWTSTMGFNTTTDWDTAGLSVTGRRYPLLRGLGGQ